eukprot:8586339-Alexandrium_andersonii.AAC.1
MNTLRWTNDYAPFSTASGKVFPMLSEWVQSRRVPPKAIVLENVKGLIMRNKFGWAPVDFIMRGATQAGKGPILH